ncbi:MAG: hypothetical protein KGZ67_06140 [Hydrogenophaga sp.]|nr:hypothetical protein [Hydrogenophaga sp.]
MKQLLVVGEDELSCSLGQQLVAQVLPAWKLSRDPINKRGVTKLIPELHRFVEQSRFQPVLCIADTDRMCPVQWLKDWSPNVMHHQFFLRLAVPEAESWVLADRKAMSEFFKISAAQIKADPEQLNDPKREVLRLALKSKVRRLRDEMVSTTDITKTGSGYNVHLSALVRENWQASRASERSSSLERAIRRLTEFGNAHR